MNIHYLHIGKTGGTALKHVLKQSVLFSENKIILHDHKTKLDDVPINDQVIFSLRNPLSRFFSAFYSRKRKGKPRYNSEWTQSEAKAFSHFSSPIELLDAASGKASEKDFLEAKMALNSIQHVKDRYQDW
jgi:hypothetical protein